MAQPVVATSKIIRGAALARAGLSGRAAREKDEVARGVAQRHVASRLGKLRGLPQKLGQIMSMSDDETTGAAYESLQESAEAVALVELLPVLEEAWGCDPYSVCESIEAEGFAASLGQVHRARLVDGNDVAIKIQYPGIRTALDADLSMLGWLSVPVGNLRRGFDMSGYKDVIRASLDEELDYLVEAKKQRAFASMLADTNVTVPGVVDGWTRRNVLVTNWEDGERLDDAAGWSEQDRKIAARNMLGMFLELLFGHGVVHADLHPGNFRFRRAVNDGMVLFDFGCTYTLSDTERLALLRLIRDTAEDSSNDPLACFVAMGFQKELLEPMGNKLPALCRVLFEPFVSRGGMDLSAWKRGERIADILGDDRWNFRMAGPASLILLMRAFHGLLHAMERLDATICWHTMLQPYVQSQAGLIDGMELPRCDRDEALAPMAKYLCVRVERGGETKVKLSLPAGAIEDLESVVGEDIRVRIEARGICLRECVRRARASGYRAGEIFVLEDGEKRVRVWLGG